ncbi:MAG TPA: molybdopterin-dependent oxidoreductase [Candidatus Deferrimicrobiaceae bacterium]|jgi:anaerobic selenocysteine-containing dehydrogenase
MSPRDPAAPAGPGCNRRDFLKGSGALLGGALLAAQLEWATGLLARAEAGTLTPAESYELARAQNILYTSCLQCNNSCGVKVKLIDGLAVKIDGSPYSPFSMVPNQPMATPPADAAKLDAPICPKGHAGLQTVYDPYRIRKVLKRAGKRGEGKWRTIAFDRAVTEIVEGGKLFAHVPGEEERHVEGLKDIWVLRDAAVAKAMADDVKTIRSAKDKKKAVADFKAKHAANLHLLIDSDHPDLGPKNNQFVYFWGRMKGGRTDFTTRFFNDCFGTVNTHTHTSACVGSMQYAGRAMMEQYDGAGFSGGPKGYWGVDHEHAEYLLCAGVNMFDANFGPPQRASRVMRRMVAGDLKITVADPRFSKLASKANRYLPVNPGQDGALFMAILRWMIENGKYDAKYLSAANKAAATASGESTWTNAALLVKIGEDGLPGKFLRASEIGLKAAETRKGKDGRERRFEFLVALKNGAPVAVDPDDDQAPVTGDLAVDGKVGGIRVKSGFRLVSDEANRQSMAGWSKLCGIPVAEIETVASELTSHGKKAAVDICRGVSMHTNGFYNVTAAATINLLLGNYDHTGGVIPQAAYNALGNGKGQPFDLPKAVPGKIGCFGISVIRHEIRYEDTTLFSGYPSKRNWYPLSSDLYMEVVPSIGDAYPYPAKALMTYMGAPVYTMPGGHAIIDILCDTTKIPLYFASDILVGPTSQFADYIFPDLSYLERWEMGGSQWGMASKVQPMRQPLIAPIPETVVVYGETVPVSYETMLMAFAEKLGMKGFGKDGFGPGQDLTRPDDYYLRMVVNVARDGAPVPDASEAELALFLDSRRHLPKSVFDADRWARIAGADWGKVVHLLNRGGRYQDYKDVYPGELVSNRYGKGINFYQEKTAGTRNSITGIANPGLATFVPVSTLSGKSPAEAGLSSKRYPLHMITQKDITQTKSRTITNYWLTTGIRPENEILVNARDAKALGFKDGDRARIVSATNRDGTWELGHGKRKQIVGRVKPTETIKPGVISFTIGHGQWASGASDIEIDGKTVPGDPRRGVGFNANASMWIDPYVKNTALVDPVGGSLSFYDTMVALEKA